MFASFTIEVEWEGYVEGEWEVVTPIQLQIQLQDAQHKMGIRHRCAEPTPLGSHDWLEDAAGTKYPMGHAVKGKTLSKKSVDWENIEWHNVDPASVVSATGKQGTRLVSWWDESLEAAPVPEKEPLSAEDKAVVKSLCNIITDKVSEAKGAGA